MDESGPTWCYASKNNSTTANQFSINQLFNWFTLQQQNTTKSLPIRVEGAQSKNCGKNQNIYTQTLVEITIKKHSTTPLQPSNPPNPSLPALPPNFTPDLPLFKKGSQPLAPYPPPSPASFLTRQDHPTAWFWRQVGVGVEDRGLVIEESGWGGRTLEWKRGGGGEGLKRQIPWIFPESVTLRVDGLVCTTTFYVRGVVRRTQRQAHNKTWQTCRVRCVVFFFLRSHSCILYWKFK